MKILIIHTKYQQPGGEDVAVNQEMELLGKHHEVEVLFFQNKGGLAGAFQFLFSVCNIWAARKVKQKINAFEPDVVHLHNWHYASGPWIIRTIKKQKLPLVFTAHNYRLLCPSGILLHHHHLFLESLSQKFPWKAVQKGVYRNSVLQTFWLAFVVWFHKKAGTWKMIDAFICLTPFAVGLFKRSSLNLPEERFIVKPNFTTPVAMPEAISRENHFLFVGRLSEEKGIRVLLEAFKDTDYKLRIAGDGPLKTLVTEACAGHSHITYQGVLSKEEVQQELHKAQALLVPSVCYEGMPMTILEAFSSGTPVIASNLGAMSTMVKHNCNGLHFTAGEADSLKATLKKFCSLPEELKTHLHSNALKEYESLYTPDKQIIWLNAIYVNAQLTNRTRPTAFVPSSQQM